MIRQKRADFSVLFLLAAAVFLMLYALCLPRQAAETVREALSLFAGRVLPSIALFSVCASILMRAGLAEMIAGSKLPLRAAAPVAVLIGSVAGFPTGASVLSFFCETGMVSKREAETLLPFCNQAGASFVVGTVGASLFGDARMGLSLFLAQVAAAFAGLVLTFDLFGRTAVSLRPEKRESVSPARVLTASVSEGAHAMLSVCGFIVFFALCISAVQDVLAAVGISLGAWGRLLLSAVLEISSGFVALSKMPLSETASLWIGGILLGFGGVSVFLQALDRTEHLFFSVRRYFSGKLLTVFLCPSFAFLFDTVRRRTKGAFGMIFAFFAVFFALLLIGYLKNKVFFKKVWKNRKECCIINMR